MTEETYEISVEHDQLIDQIQDRMREEYARSSDASESAAKTKEFLDETGLNSQAFGWLKTIMKKLPKKDGELKALDIIRSMRVGLDMVEAHIIGQGTQPMDLDGEAPDEGDDGAAGEAPEEEESGASKADKVEPIDFSKSKGKKKAAASA